MLVERLDRGRAGAEAAVPAIPKSVAVMPEKDGISLYDTAIVVVDVRTCYA